MGKSIVTITRDTWSNVPQLRLSNYSIVDNFCGLLICDRICKNPACRENAQVAQCAFLVAQVKYYQSPVFVIHIKEPFYCYTIAYGG